MRIEYKSGYLKQIRSLDPGFSEEISNFNTMCYRFCSDRNPVSHVEPGINDTDLVISMFRLTELRRIKFQEGLELIHSHPI